MPAALRAVVGRTYHPAHYTAASQSDRVELLSKRERHSFYCRRAWRDLKAATLAAQPLCRACKRAGRITLAQCVDHIEPLAYSPAEALNPDNLQPLCNSCHAKKTRREQRGTAAGQHEESQDEREAGGRGI